MQIKASITAFGEPDAAPFSTGLPSPTDEVRAEVAGTRGPHVSGEGGRDDQTHRLAMPSYRPAVMVFSTKGQGHVHLRFVGLKGRSSRLYRLSGDGSPITARIPLPVGNEATTFRVFIADGRNAWTATAWTATASPLREVPRFHEEISGTGSDLVHYRGGPGPGFLHYAGPNRIQLEVLDGNLVYKGLVTESRAGEHMFHWPGRGYYQVRSSGAWSLAIACPKADCCG
ncbi:hypothetical protein OG379_01560 [Streptomyces sp. NBC_01166]|uniref:hypothetical protein n=1 Tax=Streptomyces sp. NBC_01166 TaxID=2903755 RepID=UPI00386C629C|nr:hypothetical protein OG379_01560 [Streptomyces sp. NBC_01166]